jgi:hypothetical protein
MKISNIYKMYLLKLFQNALQRVVNINEIKKSFKK